MLLIVMQSIHEALAQLQEMHHCLRLMQQCRHNQFRNSITSAAFSLASIAAKVLHGMIITLPAVHGQTRIRAL